MTYSQKKKFKILSCDHMLAENDPKWEKSVSTVVNIFKNFYFSKI